MMILGVDAGNKRTKVVGPNGAESFLSKIGEYRERTLKQQFSKDDMIFEYNGQKGFAGTLAEMESEFGGSRKGSTKAHEEAKLRILLALHYVGGEEKDFSIVVGQPITMHTDLEKMKIKNMIQGEHLLSVNGVKKSFTIHRAEVAAEGASAALVDPKRGLIRTIDIGSGTINCATIYEGRYVDKDSFTLDFGMETTKSKDWKAMANAIINHTSGKWSEHDYVRLLGGGANDVMPTIAQHYSQCDVIQARMDNKTLHPCFTNAVAFYEIAKKVF